MTTEQIKELVALTLANFPNMQDKAMGPTITLWYEMLKDIPYTTAKAALFKVLAGAKYWPNVAEIREAAMSLTIGAPPLVGDAWAMVRESIRRDLPENRLHPAIQRAIRGFGGLDGIGYSENIDIIRSQFFKIYDPVARDEQQQAALPESVRQFIAGVVKELPTGA
jgi:hypothetical protein